MSIPVSLNLADPTLLLVILILFSASLMRSTFGFGDALVAMPLLTLVIGIQLATPIVAMVSIAISLLIIGGSWREIDFLAVRRLISAAVIGVAVGVWLFKNVPEAWVIGLLGLLLVTFGLYSTVKPALPTLVGKRWAYLCGFLAGCLGGAYNVHGPPVIVYGSLQHWPPPRFRATLQSFFLPSSIMILVGHGLGGLWSQEAFWLFAQSLIPVAVAVLLGSRLNRRIPPGRFDRLVNLVVIGLGLLLLVRLI